MAASRRVPVVSLNSSVSESPEATRAAISSGVRLYLNPLEKPVVFVVRTDSEPYNISLVHDPNGTVVDAYSN